MDRCTLVITTMGNFTATVFISRPTIALIRGSGRRTRCQVKAFINGQMVVPMKVLGLETKCMDRAKWFGPMAGCTSVAFRTTKEKAMASLGSKTVFYSKDNLRTINIMGMV